jgi:thiol-disulfide isomerase/thioredoxin
MSKTDWKKYIYAFFITAAIFATTLYIGNYFSNRKIDELRTTESRISLDILSSETQFALLGELSCPEAQNSLLSQELSSLGEKLDYGEEKFGTDDPDFIALKKQYSLLEIKDYLLIKKLRDCPKPPVTILYFYTSNCPDCDKEGYVLTYLHEQFPDLRVYSFDYNIDLSAVKTLASVYGVKDKFLFVIVKTRLYL